MRLILLCTALYFLTGCANAEISSEKKTDNHMSQPVTMSSQQVLAATVRTNAQDVEYPVPRIDEVENGKVNKFKAALNKMNFVSTEENPQNSDKVYAKIGGFKLTMTRVMSALQTSNSECKRAAAYADISSKDGCKQLITDGFFDFAVMNADSTIPGLTKRSALSEASYGNFIDFEHAARLAKMHSKGCSQQNDRGYVAMIATAVPCSGRGDVLSIDVADRLGLLR